MNTLTRFDTNALNRALVGFDQLFNNFETRFAHQINNNYPPFNIVKTGENSYHIDMAIAGFKKDEVQVEVEGDQLTVRGEKEKDDNDTCEYLHRGLSYRNFERTFQLAEHMVVHSAKIEDGILTIHVNRIIPEEKKPKLIDIVEVK